MATKKNVEKTYKEMEERMEEIINLLSNDSLSLDEQIKLGEEGQNLLLEMQKKLDEIKQKVDTISKINNEN